VIESAWLSLEPQTDIPGVQAIEIKPAPQIEAQIADQEPVAFTSAGAG